MHLRDDGSRPLCGTGAISNQRKGTFMISNTISRAACLAELTSNPKSFFNCPDLHGGLGLPEGSTEQGAGSREQGARIKKLKAETLRAKR